MFFFKRSKNYDTNHRGHRPWSSFKRFPPLYNGRVKLVNLTKEVTDSVNGYPQVNIGDNNHELELSDAGKHIYATDCTVSVPYDADVAFPIGTQIIIVAGAIDVLVNKAGGVTAVYFEGTDETSFTVAARSLATLLKTGIEEWYIYGDSITV